ncbi:MAG: PIN domain-containing protein [Candidatus Marsarchaeota archaeon]|nr:PIN domain-containing protein [Candidatus Marsarchaeota archaeon]MCL5105984.1 PIN domain-containing protein [Candidatus Marsarchaeota archaeon]
MIFLDASFIVAYINANDQNHERALKIAKDIDSGMYGPQVLSEYILDEVMTVLLARMKNYELTVSTGKTLRKYIFIKSNETLLEKTWQIFFTQKKPYISFTDCNTIGACESERITKLATFDDRLGKKSGLAIID